MSEIKAKTANGLPGLAVLAFRKYAPELHRYLLRRIRREADASDLTQEIFERFLRTDKAEAIRNPQAYLFGIASHVISDARMKHDRGLVTFDSEALDARVESADTALPDDLADRIGLEQDLSYALSKLSDTHRAVLLLVKRDGLSYEEVAQKMSLAVNTVTIYLFEARAKVKMILKRRDGR
jgi:RNA polymerase sigma-70 factor (ECF subfamily)